ncbi:hypothetical protein CWB98_06450 [Pseudoalteromonas rubra]|uniref:Uncharacterized protein n=1 Tax=Pseudoalteromonas rubra TaxID=43658 RepID=A0A5S3X232_9GAMM|nr:hypothetical protein CWB98_06450 [Pseudoalteromonas rubra]
MPVDNDEFEQRKVLYKNKVRSYNCTSPALYKQLAKARSTKQINTRLFQVEDELSSVEPDQAMGLLSLTEKKCEAYQ